MRFYQRKANNWGYIFSTTSNRKLPLDQIENTVRPTQLIYCNVYLGDSLVFSPLCKFPNHFIKADGTITSLNQTYALKAKLRLFKSFCFLSASFSLSNCNLSWGYVLSFSKYVETFPVLWWAWHVKNTVKFCLFCVFSLHLRIQWIFLSRCTLCEHINKTTRVLASSEAWITEASNVYNCPNVEVMIYNLDIDKTAHSKKFRLQITSLIEIKVRWMLYLMLWLLVRESHWRSLSKVMNHHYSVWLKYVRQGTHHHWWLVSCRIYFSNA